MYESSIFSRFSRATSREAGHPRVFGLAVLTVLTWAALGPVFGFSDTWQLVINTGTTIVTFLMVFLIQNTQNRDSQAIHIKLDELVRALEGASDALLDLEELDEKDLDRFRERYASLARAVRNGGPPATPPMPPEGPSAA